MGARDWRNFARTLSSEVDGGGSMVEVNDVWYLCVCGIASGLVADEG